MLYVRNLLRSDLSFRCYTNVSKLVILLPRGPWGLVSTFPVVLLQSLVPLHAKRLGHSPLQV